MASKPRKSDEKKAVQARRLKFGPVAKVLLGGVAFVLVLGLTTFLYFWFHFSKIIDDKLAKGPFSETAMLFAAPEPVSIGDRITAEELVAALRRRGYTEKQSNRMGYFHVREDAVEIFPGVDSYPRSEPGVVFIGSGVVTRIVSSADNTERTIYDLEPELFTQLFDRERQKRRMVKYQDLPKVLVQAVLSAEDKRFFQHAGLDPIRLAATIWEDVTENRRKGASTITMQLARTFFLNREVTWQRKASEMMITLQLEQRMSKEQIFEHYVNFIDLGWRRSFAVQGFGEAAAIHFGKDIRELKVEEAALLAGMVQGPNLYNPFRNPERSVQRRNIILGLMRDNEYISEAEYKLAVAAPLQLVQGGVESSDAPYFVDLVNDRLQDQFQSIDFQSSSYRVYTTLDMKLQRDALAAVQAGMKEVDEQLARRRRQYPQAQVALVALDPYTGEVKALIGGRSYGQSQLNRALARRQPGSIFKPFVYAAALRTALDGSVNPPLTTMTRIADEPTTFWYDGKPYEPNNFKQEFHGTVTLRQALARSMNIPTVKFAEMAGYDQVAELARDVGLRNVKGTPAVALGAYEVRPLDIAAAYTVFTNGGEYVPHSLIREIRTKEGGQIAENVPERRHVLDPRISYMVVNLMEEVINRGTGAGARSRGFRLPAAGKTGTSHDAWFAGFTSKLLCVVWVGFDDNQELPLEGSKAALPIWTEFMKRAHEYREYRGVTPFRAPDGILTVEIDPLTGAQATPACPNTRTEVFIVGTEPHELCPVHGSGRTLIADWDSTDETPARVEDGGAGDRPVRAARRAPRRAEAEAPAARAGQKREEQEEKPGLLRRFLGIFKK